MGRVGVVVPLAEVLPLSGAYLPDLARIIAERYSFASSPDFSRPLTELRESGIAFQFGKFKEGTTEHNITKLTALADAIVVDSYSTKVAKLFLDDLFYWGSKSGNLRAPHRDVRYFYLSQVVVEFEKAISKMFRDFEALVESLSTTFHKTYKADHLFNISSISFDRDRTRTPDNSLNILSSFTVERQINQPYASNRFFCTAPLHTEDHIRLLEEMEARIATG